MAKQMPSRPVIGRIEVSEGDVATDVRRGGPVEQVFRENAELRREVRRLQAENQMLRDRAGGAA